MKDVIDTILGLIIIWFFIKLILKMNKVTNNINSNDHKQHGYYVKGTWHRSGNIHTYRPDALAECEEMHKKYPEDVFYVYDTEF